MNRRQLLKIAATSVGCALLPRDAALARDQWHPIPGDEAFLDDLVHQGCMYFWEQGQCASIAAMTAYVYGLS